MNNCFLCGLESDKIADHLNFPDSKIYYCESCDYWFTLPIPSNDYLQNYYQYNYRDGLLASFSNEYILTMKKRALAQIKYIGSILERDLVSFRNLKVIDVGCGLGCLIKEMTNEGADAKGHEYDKAIIRVGERKLGVKISSKPFSSDNYRNLDLICLSHVIEHINDLKFAINGYRDSLKDGGYLFIEVPNTSMKMFDMRVDQESHLHFFTKNSLRLILEQNGFSVLSCVESGMPIDKAYSFSNKNAEIPFFKKCFYKFMKETKLEKLFYQRTIFDGYYENYNFKNSELGQWIRCVAKKL